MRKVIMWMHQSLDGYFSGPQGEFNWPVVRPALQQTFIENARTMGGFLYGRKVYDVMLAYWPTADVAPTTPTSADYARIWKPMPKFVFSKSLEQAEWNTRVIKENIAEEVTALKQQPGGDLVLYGGAEIAATFMRLNLIDEYRIFVHPVVLGDGQPLFRATEHRHKLRLIDAQTFEPGVVMLNYRQEGKEG
jgi:dihydrofolate reductase